ncbi:MAG: hypothetical protein AAF481_04590 [Acidobacteriota bacterium]
MRERDRKRVRELALVLALLIPFGLGLLTFTWLHLQVLETGFRIDRLEKELHEKARLHRQLQLEAAYIESPELIESRATSELEMVRANADRVLFWEELR